MEGPPGERDPTSWGLRVGLGCVGRGRLWGAFSGAVAVRPCTIPIFGAKPEILSCLPSVTSPRRGLLIVACGVTLNLVRDTRSLPSRQRWLILLFHSLDSDGACKRNQSPGWLVRACRVSNCNAPWRHGNGVRTNCRAGSGHHKDHSRPRWDDLASRVPSQNPKPTCKPLFCLGRRMQVLPSTASRRLTPCCHPHKANRVRFLVGQAFQSVALRSLLPIFCTH